MSRGASMMREKAPSKWHGRHTCAALHSGSAALYIALAACSGADASTSSGVDVPQQCNPLRADDPADCLTPWPSITYEERAATASGWRVTVPAEAMPANALGTKVSPALLAGQDGFSPVTPIVVHFRQGIQPDVLPPSNDLGRSLDPSAPTAILDLSGHRVLHFAEVDVNAPTPAKQALLIRPQTRLTPGARHVVVLRRSLRAADGTPLPVPAGMQAILDGTPTNNARLEALRAEYADYVFPAIDAANIPRSDVLLAWDFTAASESSHTADLLSMRDQALSLVGDGSNVAYDISKNELGFGGDGLLYTRVVGTFEAPLFLTAGGGKDGVISRDASGKPQPQGTYSVPFAALVPARAADPAAPPMPVLVVGHGFLDDPIAISEQEYPRKQAAALGMVMVLTPWTGLSASDTSTVARALTDLNKLPTVTDKLEQSVVNASVLARFARTALANDPALMPNGKGIVSKTEAYYYGQSLGGIMGSTLLAYDPDIIRGVLNVPGGGWALMLERSLEWSPLSAVLFSSYEDAIQRFVLLSCSQSLLDTTDPMTTGAHLLADPLPGSLPKQVLLQEGIGDMEVSNLATEMLARAVGVSVITPSVRVPYAITATAAPQRSGLAIYDLEPSVLPNATNAPNTIDNGVHDGVQEQPAAIRQDIAMLTANGEVTQTCSGTAGCICAAPENACQ